jgi:glycosyltransferase involved in cell wall biosynthesis
MQLINKIKKPKICYDLGNRNVPKHEFRLSVFNTQPPHLYFGGVERRILETTKRLENQAEITIYSGTKGGFRQPITINGVHFKPCFSTDRVFPLDNWFFNRSLLKEAKVIEDDVFEAHAVSGYNFPKTLRKLDINKPFVHTIHGVLADEYEQAKKSGDNSFRGRIANYLMKHLSQLEKETAEKASLIVTISNYSKEMILKHYGIEASKITIVPNGVDPEKFKPIKNSENIRRQFGLGNGLNVLFVGSLIPRKGVIYLVNAAKVIVDSQPNTKFIIVGDGPLKYELKDSVKAVNLSKNFKFMGSIKEEQLTALYNCADVFVLPSIQEGQGIVTLEAQSSAKPVVAFDIGGVKEAVRNGETGLLVEAGNTDALAEGLLKILTDAQLRAKMGANGRQFIMRNFTWDICARKMLKIYLNALSTKR